VLNGSPTVWCTAQRARTASAGGVSLVVLSVLSMQGGQALAKAMLLLAGPLPVAALRFTLGAVILLLLWRPRLPTDRPTRLAVLGLGTSLAGVNGFIYQAFVLLPLGLAVALQFLGALAVSLAGARRRPLHAIWAVLSVLGVILIVYGPSADVSAVGVLFALASAACWGAYILLSAEVGARTTGGTGLALATAWAALLTLPLGLVAAPTAFTYGPVLAVGLGVAILSTVLANSFELASLRRLPASVFAVLLSLEPAVAALAGLVLLGEHLTAWQWLAIICIVVASIGATRKPPPVGTHPVRSSTASPLTYARRSRT
jgi:inner membrane transporter RhtA